MLRTRQQSLTQACLLHAWVDGKHAQIHIIARFFRHDTAQDLLRLITQHQKLRLGIGNQGADFGLVGARAADQIALARPRFAAAVGLVNQIHQRIGFLCLGKANFHVHLCFLVDQILQAAYHRPRAHSGRNRACCGLSMAC